MSIQRYEFDGKPRDDGPVVFYTDHAAAIATRDRRIASLEAALRRIATGKFGVLYGNIGPCAIAEAALRGGEKP